jgi:glycosyltransferase involved in cell wall biosynthesis
MLYSLFSTAFRFIDRRAWKHYRGVVAISGEVKRRITAGRLCDEDRIMVAYPGIDWAPRVPDVVYQPFVLVSGRIMWTKNIELAVRAFRAARLPAPWKLVVAGYVDKKSAPYLAALRELAGDAAVEFVVSPSDDAMDDLLRRASFCLFTAFNEDWGIVPLEAMANAKPVIAFNSGGPRESMLHGVTGYLLPAAAAAWATAIAELAGNPELVRRLGAQAHAHVERFSWPRFIDSVDNALEAWVMQDRQQAAGPAQSGAIRQEAELSTT